MPWLRKHWETLACWIVGQKYNQKQKHLHFLLDVAKNIYMKKHHLSSLWTRENKMTTVSVFGEGTSNLVQFDATWYQNKKEKRKKKKLNKSWCPVKTHDFNHFHNIFSQLEAHACRKKNNLAWSSMVIIETTVAYANHKDITFYIHSVIPWSYKQYFKPWATKLNGTYTQVGWS